MGELFPIIVVIIAVLVVIATLAYKSNKLKPAEEQDVVVRFKLGMSRANAKLVADGIVLAANQEDEKVSVYEYYEEGTNCLIRIEIS